MLDSLFDYNANFVTFGSQHIWMIVMTVALAGLLPAVSRRILSARGQLILARAMSLLIAATAILWVAVRIALNDFDKTTDLPLDICNLSALLIPIMMWRPKRAVHEVLYFWVSVGTLQAVLTPHLFNGFPNFTFLKYWIVHGGLVVYIVYVTVVLRLVPNWRSVWKAALWLQLYTVVMFGLNSLLGSNYFYIMRKPPTASLLDYFGSWPWYLLVCEGLMLILFMLAYLPVRRKGVAQPDQITSQQDS